MGNFIKQIPVGIDIPIQNLQKAIYDNFLTELNLLDNQWNSYGRIYRLFDNEAKEYLPYPFDSGTEYKNPALFEDTVTLQSFFDILETQKIGEDAQASCKVNLYFFSNLNKLFPSNVDRADETLVNQISSYVDRQFGFIVREKKIGIKSVMKDYSGYAKESVMSSNEQPLFAFCLELELDSYYICYSSPNFNLRTYETPIIPKIPYTRYNPTGIDSWIQRFQIDLYNFILTICNGQNGFGTITQEQYNCFGRIYRNYRAKNSANKTEGNQYYPQAFVKILQTGSMEYVDVLFQDTITLQSFFDIGEVRKIGEDDLLTRTEIKLFFFVDLSKIYTTAQPTATRMDEEFITMISQFVMESSPGFELTSQKRGIKAIMNEYSGFKIKNASKANMQNLLCFRLDMNKYYDDSMENCPFLIPQREFEFNPAQFDPTQFQ